MPVTARLSLKFYERFGEDIAQELVDWMNQVDSSYRADLASLNELNFARFDAKLEQRVAELDARFGKRFAELDARVEKRFAEQDAKFEKRFAEQDARFEKRFAEQDAWMAERFAAAGTALERQLGELRADLLKWVFIFVAGGTGTILGVLLAFLRS